MDATLQILSLMTSVLFVDQLASFVKRRHVRMLWYSSQWFAGIFYGLPTVFINSILIKLRQRYYYVSACFLETLLEHMRISFKRILLQSKLNTENEAYLLIAVLQSFYTLLLLVVSFFGARSIYFLAIMLVPMAVSMVVLHSGVFAGRSGKMCTGTDLVNSSVSSLWLLTLSILILLSGLKSTLVHEYELHSFAVRYVPVRAIRTVVHTNDGTHWICSRFRDCDWHVLLRVCVLPFHDSGMCSPPLQSV